MNNRDNFCGIMLLILVELLLITACIRTGATSAIERQANWSGHSGHAALDIRK